MHRKVLINMSSIILMILFQSFETMASDMNIDLQIQQQKIKIDEQRANIFQAQEVLKIANQTIEKQINSSASVGNEIFNRLTDAIAKRSGLGDNRVEEKKISMDFINTTTAGFKIWVRSQFKETFSSLEEFADILKYMSYTNKAIEEMQTKLDKLLEEKAILEEKQKIEELKKFAQEIRQTIAMIDKIKAEKGNSAESVEYIKKLKALARENIKTAMNLNLVFNQEEQLKFLQYLKEKDIIESNDDQTKEKEAAQKPQNEL